MEEGNSLRDEMKDSIRGCLADYHHISEDEVDAKLVADLADVVFDVMKVTERMQDAKYSNFASIVGSMVRVDRYFSSKGR